MSCELRQRQIRGSFPFGFAQGQGDNFEAGSGGFFGGDEGLDAGVEAGFVAAGGVLVQDAFLHGLVVRETVSEKVAAMVFLSPAAMASRRKRRVERSLVRLARLTAVLVSVWRARFREET